MFAFGVYHILDKLGIFNVFQSIDGNYFIFLKEDKIILSAEATPTH